MSPVALPLDWAAASRRARASLGDLGVIAGWLAGLTVAGVAVRALPPESGADTPPPEALPVVDVAVFAGTVLPVWIYLTATEAGPQQATWGKRWVGLQVTNAVGDGPGLARAAARNAVKLLPWQLGHLAVTRFITGVEPSPGIWTACALSLVLPVVTVALAVGDLSGRALHDRVASTVVVAAGTRDVAVR